MHLVYASTIGALVTAHHADIAKAAALALGLVAHYLTALLTHQDASPRLKSTVATVFSVAGGVVATTVWADSQPWYLWVEDIGRAVMVSQSAYLLRAVTGGDFLSKIGFTFGNPDSGNPTDPSVFPGASDTGADPNALSGTADDTASGDTSAPTMPDVSVSSPGVSVSSQAAPGG